MSRFGSRRVLTARTGMVKQGGMQGALACAQFLAPTARDGEGSNTVAQRAAKAFQPCALMGSSSLPSRSIM